MGNEKTDRPLGVGSIVVIGTTQGTLFAKVKKIAKKDLTLRVLKKPAKMG
jgi:hypothetical protein